MSGIDDNIDEDLLIGNSIVSHRDRVELARRFILDGVSDEVLIPVFRGLSDYSEIETIRFLTAIRQSMPEETPVKEVIARAIRYVQNHDDRYTDITDCVYHRDSNVLVLEINGRRYGVNISRV